MRTTHHPVDCPDTRQGLQALLHDVENGGNRDACRSPPPGHHGPDPGGEESVNRRAVVVLALVAAGCAGRLDYVRPTADPRMDNVKTIDRPRDVVWNAAVPALGKQFFVINHLERRPGSST